MDTPAIKKIIPKMANAQGLNVAIIGVPKIPKTPKINPAIPTSVKTNANILIIINLDFFKNKNNLNSQNYIECFEFILSLFVMVF